ncbi:MAG: rhomboid family intramembrane serine protease [Myxococcota bacterium]|nr:rhomboid family intramembrane serine protease [Myxococcota bacterium]
MRPLAARRARFAGGTPRAVRFLLIATAAAYAVELLLVHWLDAAGVVEALWLVPRDVIERGRVWQVATYMWLHDPAGPWHLLLNLLGLWVFGGPMERRWGASALVRFYLLTGAISGGVVLAAGWFLHPDVPTIGCSGAVLALAAAFGIVHANAPILLFGVFPMRARVLLLLIVAMVAVDGLAQREGISVAGHAGGLAAGALLVTGWWRPSKLRRALVDRPAARRRVRFERGDGEREGRPWIN